jgi:hypothetical protein
MNNTNTAAAAVLTTLTAFEAALTGFDPGLAREFATGLRSCATWRDTGEVIGFYGRVLAQRVGALAVFVAAPLTAYEWRWDLVHVAEDLASECRSLTGPAPRPAQGELF